MPMATGAVRRASGLGVEGGAELGEAGVVEGVPDPLAAPVAVDEAGLGEDPQVVRDGPLALADGGDELADADLAGGGGGEHGEEPEPDGVAESPEASGELPGGAGVEGGGEDGRAANGGIGAPDDGGMLGGHSPPIDKCDCIDHHQHIYDGR